MNNTREVKGDVQYGYTQCMAPAPGAVTAIAIPSPAAVAAIAIPSPPAVAASAVYVGIYSPAETAGPPCSHALTMAATNALPPYPWR